MGAGTLLALLLLKGWPAITVRWQPVTPELPALRDLADDESDKEEEEEDPAIRPPAHIIAKAETLVLFQRVVQTKPELLQHIWRSQHMMANFNEQPLGREFLLNEHQIKINAQPLSMCFAPSGVPLSDEQTGSQLSLRSLPVAGIHSLEGRYRALAKRRSQGVVFQRRVGKLVSTCPCDLF